MDKVQWKVTAKAKVEYLGVARLRIECWAGECGGAKVGWSKNIRLTGKHMRVKQISKIHIEGLPGASSLKPDNEAWNHQRLPGRLLEEQPSQVLHLLFPIELFRTLSRPCQVKYRPYYILYTSEERLRKPWRIVIVHGTLKSTVLRTLSA